MVLPGLGDGLTSKMHERCSKLEMGLAGVHPSRSIVIVVLLFFCVCVIICVMVCRMSIVG